MTQKSLSKKPHLYEDSRTGRRVVAYGKIDVAKKLELSYNYVRMFFFRADCLKAYD